MAEREREPDEPRAERQEPEGSGCSGWLIGCGTVAGVLLLALIVGGIYVYVNFHSIVSGVANASVRSVVRNSQLPENQKTKILDRVDALKKKYDRGDVSTGQLAKIANKLSQGPLMTIGTVRFLEVKYIEGSSLSKKEKKQAHRTLDRFARGLDEEKIAPGALEKVTEPLRNKDQSGKQKYKSNPTKDELRIFLDAARKRVEKAGIPDEPYNVDVAGKFNRVVEEVLNKNVESGGT